MLFNQRPALAICEGFGTYLTLLNLGILATFPGHVDFELMTQPSSEKAASEPKDPNDLLP